MNDTAANPRRRQRVGDIWSRRHQVGSAVRDSLSWRITVAVLVVFAIGLGLATIASSDYLDDGFIAYQPDESMFPPPPVDDAATAIGIGRPEAWPDWGSDCPYSTYVDGSGIWSAFGNGWHTARHDWSVDGSDKSWIIGERTLGFRDLAEYDAYIRGTYNRTKYCGWNYDTRGYENEYNSIMTELDGLPDGAFAFTIDLSPYSYLKPGDPTQSNPDEFHAIGAMLPGRTRGQLMSVIWIGWGVDVPRDEFVATANRLYDAAHKAPTPSTPGDEPDAGGGSDDETIDVDSIELDVERAGVASTLDGYVDESDELEFVSSRRCARDRPLEGLKNRSAGGSRAQQTVTGPSQTVLFTAVRWSRRSSYEAAKPVAEDSLAPTCIDSVQHRTRLIERLTVPGLPDGAVVAAWHEGNYYTAILTDDDSHSMMVVIWAQGSPGFPTERFVSAVNQAWTQFRTDNP